MVTAQRRVIPFFCPMRASSANQTSIAPGSQPWSRAMLASVAGKFFKSLNRAFRLRIMARASRKPRVAHRPQFPAQRLHRYRDAKFQPQPMAKITKSPAHHAVNRWYRAAVNLRSQRLAMGIGQDRPRGAIHADLSPAQKAPAHH
jgi:hypothetical protein